MNFFKILKTGIVLFLSTILVNAFAQLPADGWDFNYPGDEFNSDALLNLRFLNEQTAGETGFIALSEDGNSFVDGTGKPIRFWCINGGTLARKFSDTELANYARFLAKMGVNMIRFHGSINPEGKEKLVTDVDEKEIDAIWRMVAAMKKEGIYSTISPFWAHNGHMGGWVPEEWGIDGYSGKDDLWGVMYFDDTLKAGYKAWVGKLYTQINPHTGIALKDDPGVAIVQVKNEDGVFFWTIQNVKESLKKKIRQQFYMWLIGKYGDIISAKNSWAEATLPGDRPKIGEMDIYQIWEATQNQTESVQKRLTDQIEFMANVQRNFYKEMYDYYRELGCKQLINGNNWKTANSARLLDAERWTNSVCEVIATNRYYDPGHEGTNNGWRIDPGHFYQGVSALKQPNKLPINIKQPVGHPVMVTESGWNLPHKYQAEGPFLVAAYMSLTGVDGFYWFNPSAENYDTNPYHTWTQLEGEQHPMHRWTTSTPMQIGMFPANALLYRLAYLQEGDVSIYEERTLKSIWERKIPVITEEMGFDPNRINQNAGNESTQFNALTYLTGKVQVKYDCQNNSVFVHPEQEKLIDLETKKVNSNTGELNWNYEKGICIMDAPLAQGVCGFLSTEKQIDLSDVTIFTENDYAAIQVVSVDGKPLNRSEDILIQVGTVSQPTNWKETPAEFELRGNKVAGFKIENTGKMPWKIANTQV